MDWKGTFNIANTNTIEELIDDSVAPSGLQLAPYTCIGFSFAPGFSKLFGAQGSHTESVESSFLIHQGSYHDLFVCP